MKILQTQPSLLRTSFHERVLHVRRDPLRAAEIRTLQVNVGYRCNLSCPHCHIEAGPGRSEIMNGDTIDAVVRALSENPLETLDITGGAPELNPHFRRLVNSARSLGKRILVRTNLAVLQEQKMADLPVYFRDHGVELIASLPCYLQENVDRMRGNGTFAKCIASLRTLNTLGYGTPDGLPLRLVYNPAGPFLPPAQEALERDYRRVLREQHGILFTSLYALINLPVGRFRSRLINSNDLDRYHGMLADSFNPATLDGVMCRTLVSVGWDGRLYDCDFNQVLGMAVGQLRDFAYDALAGRTICVGDHCYGCTAGSGSTCTGAVV